VQKALAKTWSDIDSTAEVKVLKTIEEAVTTARGIAGDWARQVGADAEVMVLITGSLHLVGGALEMLETHPAK
jgi:folylpolyglutamate synthase